MKTIAICSSASFYREVIELQGKLEKLGFKVIIPLTANIMKRTGDYDTTHYKTWFKNTSDYHKKTHLMQAHLKEVKKSDAILVVNNEKHGIKNYIGGSVLIEMGLAFYLNKPIFILNEAPKESPLIEEIMGMNPVALRSDINGLVGLLDNV